MEKYDYAEKVVKALIQVLSFYLPCKETLDLCKNKPRIFINSNTYTLDSVQFAYFDIIVCTSKGVKIVREHGKKEKIMEYDGFDSLLNMVSA